MKINYGRFLASAVVFIIVATIVHNLGAMLTMDYYTDPDYFPVWSKIMMPGEGPPPAEFMYYSIGFSFITALIYVFVYLLVKKSIPGKSPAEKGIYYGFLVLFLLGGIPGFLSMYLLINIPAMLLVFWAFESLVISLVGGALIGYLNK